MLLSHILSAFLHGDVDTLLAAGRGCEIGKACKSKGDEGC